MRRKSRSPVTRFGALLSHKGTEKHQDELFTRAHDEMVRAPAAVANFPAAIYARMDWSWHN